MRMTPGWRIRSRKFRPYKHCKQKHQLHWKTQRAAGCSSWPVTTQTYEFMGNPCTLPPTTAIQTRSHLGSTSQGRKHSFQERRPKDEGLIDIQRWTFKTAFPPTGFSSCKSNMSWKLNQNSIKSNKSHNLRALNYWSINTLTRGWGSSLVF